MTRGFSKAIITGNLTRDPEMRNTTSGAAVCSFTVAVNRTFRDGSGNQQEAVSFFDCSAWGKPGEIINQYAKKGTGILVSGRLDQRSWDDKNTGQKRSRYEIVVEDFNFLGGIDRDMDSFNGGGSYSSYGNSNGSANSAASANTSAQTESAGDADMPDDVPEEIDLSEIPF